MPPKNKGKKKEVEPEPVKPEESEYSREELKIKIAAHELRIMRLRSENTELKEKSDRVQKEMEESTSQSIEMFTRLTERMDSKDKEIAKMRAESANFEEEKNRLELELRNQLTLEKEDKEALRERLQEQIDSLQHRLDEVSQFRLEKEAVAKKIESLEALVEELKVKHKAEVDRLREEHREEREKLRTDMIKKWRKTRLEVYKLTEDHLQTKTQQTIQENERLTRDLDVYSREVRDMMKHNSKLMEENTTMKRSLELEQRSVEELMKKSYLQQRAIKTLMQKLKAVEDASHRVSEDKSKARDDRITSLSNTLDSQYELILELRKELDETQQELDHTRNELRAAQRESMAAVAGVTDTQRFLVGVMEDIKASLLPDETLADLSLDDKLSMVQLLIERLQGYESGFHPSVPRISSGSASLDGALVVPHAPTPPQAPAFGAAPRSKEHIQHTKLPVL